MKTLRKPFPVLLSVGTCLCLPAAAQTNVTLYGLIDAAIDVSSQGAGTVTRLESGGTYGSRWGLKGSEDLGGGLKAIFQLEQGFALDTGFLQQGGRAFGRHAWVGLEGSWGQLTFGRQLSPQYYAFLYTDAFELGSAGGLQGLTRTNDAGVAAFAMSSYVRTGREDNSIVYTSPTFNGFSGRLMAALGESPEGGQSRGGAASASLRYAAGPVDLNAGYTRHNDSDGAGGWTAWSVGGSYVLGNARIYLGHTLDRNTSADTPTATGVRQEFRLTNLGVRYKLTPRVTAVGQVYRVGDRSDGRSGSRDATVVAAGMSYELSKRTVLYGSVGTVGNQNGSRYSLGGAMFAGNPVTGDARAKTLTVGLRHSF